MSDLERQIELYLLTQGTWVSAAELVERFQISERQLRADKGKPGLCSIFAISNSTLGYKHVRCATAEEFEEAHRRDRHWVASRFTILRRRKAYRQNCLTGTRGQAYEVHSGQGVLL